MDAAEARQRNGLLRIGQGREAEVFLQPDGTVVKLMRDPRSAGRVRAEFAALEALAATASLVPVPIRLVSIDGRPGLVTTRARGPDLLSLLGRRPWLIWRTASTMARVHQRIHDVPAPDALPDLNAVLRVRIGSAKQLPHDLKASALSMLDSLPRGDRICHGDFHPGNVLGSLDAPVVIDWPDAARGDPLADVAGTELLVRFGEVPPGTSLLVRGASAAVRRIIAERYVTVYRRVRPFDPRILLRWKIVQAAARFSAEIPSEYEALRAFLVSAGRLTRSSR